MKSVLASWLTALVLLLSAAQAYDDPRAEVDKILAAKEAPPGIVFEIMTGDADALDVILPQVEELAAYLGETAPALALVVVAHGNEMFALKSSESFIHEQAHASARRLVDAGVDVVVCGAYANMRRVDWSEFLDYVTVAESGPAQVNDYRALDYAVVFIGDPNYTPRSIED